MDDYFFSRRTIWVNGPIIVGAGPAGLAVAACLREHGVPSVVLEGGDCIASAWKKRIYDDSPKLLVQHKQLCELPRMPFPEHYPKYPTPRQFIDYLEQYAAKFEIRPRYNTAVQAARYDETSALWRVATASLGGVTQEFCGRWFIVATGEDAESKIPYIPGLSGFDGEVTHFSNYRSGESYRGKRVLVVGCGNSGMEVSLDLCNHGARPSLVLRDAVHVLPGEVVGKSILDLAVLLLRCWLPLWLVDKILVLLAWLLLGDLTRFGFRRPTWGPLEIVDDAHGRAPVLDYGAVARIRAGDIQVVPAVIRFTNDQFELIDGRAIDVDAVIFATGYHIAVPQWFQLLAQRNKQVFNHDGRYHNIASWKGQCGLYAVGFRHHDVLSASYTDAMHIANDLGSIWREETKPVKRTGGTRRRWCSAVIF